ncbi:MAG: hypothetical protein JJU05_12250 [Verrucomicrobia bacterium]|nr:hypothetical protein [Verrucomicrobiota bacterium]
MNEETLIQYAGEPFESIPEGLQDQLKQDPQLKQAFEQQLLVKQLMGLKRYETPDPRLSERLCRAVRLSAVDHKPLGQRLSFQNAHLLPAWVRMAAVVVVMLGLSVLTHREMLRNEMADALDLAQEAEQGMELVATADLNSLDRLQASELVHRDAFTTQLPERFLFPLPDFDPNSAQPDRDFALQPQPEPTVAPFLQQPMSLPVIHISRP